jgi:hypothetical protein
LALSVQTLLNQPRAPSRLETPRNAVVWPQAIKIRSNGHSVFKTAWKVPLPPGATAGTSWKSDKSASKKNVSAAAWGAFPLRHKLHRQAVGGAAFHRHVSGTHVSAVKGTGRKQLIITGVVTEVCVAFPALSAVETGYEVFVVTDASGTFNEVTRHAAWA